MYGVGERRAEAGRGVGGGGGRGLQSSCWCAQYVLRRTPILLSRSPVGMAVSTFERAAVSATFSIPGRVPVSTPVNTRVSTPQSVSQSITHMHRQLNRHFVPAGSCACCDRLHLSALHTMLCMLCTLCLMLCVFTVHHPVLCML